MALANPRTESALITLAAAVAQQKDGRILATHIVTVPDQTALKTAAENRERIDASSKKLLTAAQAYAESFGVPVETTTILSHRGIEEVFDAARTHDADTVVMGYGGAQFAGGRTRGPLDDLTHDLTCDFPVLDGQELDLSNVLVPTAGGPSSDLSAEVARALQITVSADVTLLHVVNRGEEESGQNFLRDWADSHQLMDADLHVETGNTETIIGQYGTEYDLVI